MKNYDYFNYLCDSVMAVGAENHSYKKLCSYLHGITWFSVLPEDDDRAYDALNLRDVFEEETGVRVDDQTEGIEPTVLEFMVYLSKKMAYIMDDGTQIDSAWYYFTCLIRNLNIHYFTDNSFDADARNSVDYRINVALARAYQPDGSGGFFPLRHPKKDQRDVGIWYQLNAWLIENNDLSV